jgi:hypothetical protein
MRKTTHERIVWEEFRRKRYETWVEAAAVKTYGIRFLNIDVSLSSNVASKRAACISSKTRIEKQFLCFKRDLKRNLHTVQLRDVLRRAFTPK